MDFFNLASFKEPRVSMSSIRDWAGTIANSYISSGADPSESLTKLAQSNDLTPSQIQTLAGEVNKAIHQVKIASTQEKYHAADFPLADAAKIIKGLQLNGGEEKFAYSYKAPIIDAQPDINFFGVEPEAPMSKTASVKYDLKKGNEKLALLKSKTQDAEFMNKQATLKAANDFIKVARDLVMDGDREQGKLKILGSIEDFCKQAGMHDVAKPMLAKLASNLTKEGFLLPVTGKKVTDYYMSKQADLKAPDELINYNMKARIVNGNHPLFITLKTVKDCQSNLQELRDQTDIIDNKLQITRQYIRAL